MSQHNLLPSAQTGKPGKPWSQVGVTDESMQLMRQPLLIREYSASPQSQSNLQFEGNVMTKAGAVACMLTQLASC